MGFKFNLQPKQQKKTTQTTSTVSPISRRCGGEAIEIMENYSKRIEEQICREDVKILLKKCLFKMVAAESVEQEIGFLSEMRILLDKPMSQQTLFLKEQSKDLSKLIREMYEIAIDKQIDQHYHKSSKYIDHLNVLDDRFRFYALSTISTCPEEIMRQMQSYNLYNNYDEEYTIRRGDHRQHYDIDDEYDYEDEYPQEEYAYHSSSDGLEDHCEDDQHGVLLEQQDDDDNNDRQPAQLDSVDQSDLRESNSQIGQQGEQESEQEEEEKEMEQKENEQQSDEEDKDYESIFSHRTRWLNREVFSNLQWPRQFSSHRGQNKEEDDEENENENEES